MEVLYSFEKVPIKDFLSEYVEYEINNSDKKSIVGKEHKKKLLGESKKINGAQAFEKAGVMDTTEITTAALRRVRGFLINSELEPTVASDTASAIKAALYWGLDNHKIYGFKVEKSDVARCLKMPSKKPEKIIQLSEEELHNVRTMLLGKDSFEHKQNRVMILTLALGHGLRPANEIVTLNDDDFNEQEMEMRIHRKGKVNQIIPLRKQDVIDISEFIKSKNEYIANYHKNKNVSGKNTNALFINIKPNQKNGIVDWRLKSDQPGKMFSFLRPLLKIDEDKVFGTLRHSSCTMQQQNAMSMGYHEKYAATLNAHTEQTERDYYVSILGPEIEVLSRFPDQNLELCENILAFCLKSYSEEPHRTRHLACALNTIATTVLILP